MKPEFWLV